MIAASLAGTWSLIAFITYSWKTLSGETHPNISSWAIWSFLTILNFTSYKKVTGDWVKAILPTANAVMTLVTLFCALRTGSFEKLGLIDSICCLLGLSAGLAWYLEKSPTLAQILLQIAIVIGFIPTFIGAYHSPGSELWQSWALWTIAFASQFIAVKYTWKGKYIDFLYPTLMFLCHLFVFLLAIG